MNVAADLGREASLRAMWRALYAASCCVETESETGGVTNVAQWFDYAPYGSVIASTNTGQALAGRQYIGQFYDSSGLSYLNARYYNGTQGQFLSEDPTFLAIGDPYKLQQFTQESQQQFLRDPQQMNSYSYGRDNPVTGKDPTGLFPWDAIFTGGEIIEQGQYYLHLGKYANMTPEQRIEAKPEMSLESWIAIPGALAFQTVAGVQLMLAGYSLQGLDYGCAKLSCPPMNLAANGMTPLQIQQQITSSMAPQNYVSISGASSGSLNFASFNNLFSASVQTRQTAAQSINVSSGNSAGSGGGGGGGVPSNNSLWVTPSGAVVTFGGQLVAPPPRK